MPPFEQHLQTMKGNEQETPARRTTCVINDRTASDNGTIAEQAGTGFELRRARIAAQTAHPVNSFFSDAQEFFE